MYKKDCRNNETSNDVYGETKDIEYWVDNIFILARKIMFLFYEFIGEYLNKSGLNHILDDKKWQSY